MSTWNEDDLPNAIQRGRRPGLYGCRRATTRDILLMLQRSAPSVKDVLEEAQRLVASGAIKPHPPTQGEGE